MFIKPFPVYFRETRDNHIVNQSYVQEARRGSKCSLLDFCATLLPSYLQRLLNNN